MFKMNIKSYLQTLKCTRILISSSNIYLKEWLGCFGKDSGCVETTTFVSVWNHYVSYETSVRKKSSHVTELELRSKINECWLGFTQDTNPPLEKSCVDLRRSRFYCDRPGETERPRRFNLLVFLGLFLWCVHFPFCSTSGLWGVRWPMCFCEKWSGGCLCWAKDSEWFVIFLFISIFTYFLKN